VLTCPDFLANPSEITCVIGRNGSGKSTLLRTLGGIIKPEKGKILINNNGENLKGRCTWLEASDQLVPFLSVQDHLRAASNKRDYSRYPIDGEENLLDTASRISDLSTGQRQALRLEMCFLNHRAVILADESTANLDPINGKSAFEVFEGIVKKEKISAIFVTHDLFLASKYAKRIYIVADGKVLQLLENNQEARSPEVLLGHLLREKATCEQPQSSD